MIGGRQYLNKSLQDFSPPAIGKAGFSDGSQGKRRPCHQQHQRANQRLATGAGILLGEQESGAQRQRRREIDGIRPHRGARRARLRLQERFNARCQQRPSRGKPDSLNRPGFRGGSFD